MSFFSRSGRDRSRLPDDIVDLIEASGLPWHIENRTKHFALIIDNELAAIYPHGGIKDNGPPWREKKFKAAIKKFILKKQGVK